MRSIVLASKSPRRAELLRAAGIPFEPIAIDIDETLRDGESAAQYVHRLAIEKAEAGARDQPGRIVLGADTTVVVDGQVLAKPEDDADAFRMLRALSGRAHEVLTGVALAGPAGTRAEVARTDVVFRAIDDDAMARYVASGEPRDRAGAYAIQGGAATFVTKVEGSYTNVVGLPIRLVCRLLLEYPEG